jgi:hypothetical protein
MMGITAHHPPLTNYTLVHLINQYKLVLVKCVPCRIRSEKPLYYTVQDYTTITHDTGNEVPESDLEPDLEDLIGTTGIPAASLSWKSEPFVIVGDKKVYKATVLQYYSHPYNQSGLESLDRLK